MLQKKVRWAMEQNGVVGVKEVVEIVSKVLAVCARGV